MNWVRHDLLFSILVLLFIFRLSQAWPLYTPDKLENNHLFELRTYFSSQIDKTIPEPQSTVIKGILFGIKEDLGSDLKKSFSNTSTIHIIVASGQNLVILSGFILGLARFFGRKKAILATILIDLLYCFITGFQIPIIRAFIMVVFASSAQLFNRDWDSKYVLLVTVLIMLIFDPNLLLSISFQLSFLATFAVIVVAPILINSFHRVPNLFKEDLLITISAQLLTLPVIAANFNQLSLTGIIANVLILWTITPIMFLGFIGVLLSSISLFLAKFVLFVPFLLVSYLIDVVTFLNQLILPLPVGKTTLDLWIGYYFIVGAILILFSRTRATQEDKSLIA